MNTFFRAFFAILIAVFLCSGCASPVESRHSKAIKEEAYSLDETMHVSEDELDNYLWTAYMSISPSYLSIEEQELITDKEFLTIDFPEFERELGNFIRKKLPYLNMNDPTPKDLSFLLRYGDVVYCYREYLAIDMSNLSQDEINSIREFRRANPSGEIDPRNFSGWETAALESLRIFVNFENVSDRGIVLFHRVGIRLPRSSPGPARSVWSQ